MDGVMKKDSPRLKIIVTINYFLLFTYRNNTINLTAS